MRRRHLAAHCGPWPLGFGAVICLAILSASPKAESRPPRPVARLEIVLSTPPTLTDTTRGALITEVTTIWRRERVKVEWHASVPDQAPTTHRLRVLVIPGPGIAGPARAGHYVQDKPLDGRPETVGELLRSGDGHVLATASLDTAERIVRSSQPELALFPDALYHHRLGLVLGRAVAHEIGHYLLDTRTHTQGGLMRARFDATEFTDVRSGTFFLDREAAVWLESRIAGAPLALAN